MLPPWSLGALLLSSVLGFPVYHNDTRNITSNDDVSHESLHLNSNASVSSNECEDSSCNQTLNLLLLKDEFKIVMEYDQISAMNPLMLHEETMNKIPCPLSTCSLHHLASILRPGDENAGSTVSDPYGPGKK